MAPSWQIPSGNTSKVEERTLGPGRHWPLVNDHPVSPSGKDSLFQLVNFSWSRPLGGMMGTGDISFRIPGHHRSVTLHTLQGEAQTLQPTKEGRNIEYRLPQFGAYAAVEVKV